MLCVHVHDNEVLWSELHDDSVLSCCCPESGTREISFGRPVVLGYGEDTPMRLGRSVGLIVLTTEERDTLERWARRPTTCAC